MLARLIHAPFRVTGTDLPPNLLLIAKLSVVALLFKGYHLVLPDVFAPTVPLLEGLPAPYFRWMLEAGFAVGAFGVVFNVRVRQACLVLGAVFILATMSNRAYYRNANFFVGAMFVMIGVDERERPGRFLAWQLGVMYVACGLNKLLEADWRSGQYFDHYFTRIYESGFYAVAAPLFPGRSFALMLCWSVIVAELTAGALFLSPRLRRMAVWFGTSVHAGAAMMVGMDYGVFLWVVLASYLVAAPWPERLTVQSVARIVADGREWSGLAATWRLGLWTPAVSLAAMTALTLVRDPWLTRAVRLTGAVASVVLAVALAMWIAKSWRNRRTSALALAGQSS